MRSLLYLRLWNPLWHFTQSENAIVAEKPRIQAYTHG